MRDPDPRTVAAVDPDVPGGAPSPPELLALSDEAVAGGWLALLAASAVLATAIATAVRPLARALVAVPSPSQLPLPSAAGDVRPEPREQALYLVALVVPPLVVWALSLAARRLPRPSAAALARAALAVQVAVAAGVAFTFRYQARKVHSYFPNARTALGLAATLLVLAGVWAWRRGALRGWLESAPGRRALRASGPVAIAAAAAYTVARLASVVFDDASILGAPVTVSYHLPFTLGEFAAVMNGRTPGVDYFPQYASLLPHALAPVFRLTGLTVRTFTLAMATLSFVALMLQYDVLRRVTGRAEVALALYVPFVALAFHPVEVFPNGDIAMAFNYFAVGPLRYFGPWVVAWLVVWHLSRPSAARATLVFAAAGLSALNNLDFGVPALGGAAIALGLAGGAPLLPRPRPLASLLAAAVAGLAAAFAAFQLVAWVHSGRLVSLSDMTVFQRAFAVLGFAMLPMPRWGLHWVVYATFMLGLGTAVVRLAALRRVAAGCPEPTATRERVVAGALLFGSVFGAGTLSYYIGRSHPAVLPAVFGAWGSVLLLLCWLALRAAPGTGGGRRVRLVPALLAVGALAVCAGEALPVRFPETALYPDQFARETVAHVIEAPRAAARLRELASPGERVMVASTAGHLVAWLAGVDDVFPFTDWGSCIVVGQLDEIVARMRADRVTKYFGPASPELKARVAAAGLEVAFLDLRAGGR